MPVDFTAIDFETANRSPASACGVGLVRVRDGRVVERAGWLIHPPTGHDHFEPFNVQLHGISKERVTGARTWTQQLESLIEFIGDDTIVAHNSGFDLGVIAAACIATQNEIAPELPVLRHLCSLRVARNVYDLPRYRLPVAAEAAGFTNLQHHDPISDAEAAAAIIVDSSRRVGATDVISLAAKTRVEVRELDLAHQRGEALKLVDGATFR